MIETKDRADNSTVVWHKVDPSTPYLTISSYKVKTKSSGDKTVLLLSSYPEISSLGVTTDDGHRKSMAFKVYDFTKVGTDVQGIAPLSKPCRFLYFWLQQELRKC